MKKWILLLVLCVGVWAEPFRLSPDVDLMARESGRMISLTRYDEALRRSAPPLSNLEPAYPAFRALAYIVRYDDLGQKSDLDQADRELRAVSSLAKRMPQNETRTFWEGFALIHEGYVLVGKGNTLRGAMRSGDGAALMAKLPKNSDAQGFVALYQFYKDELRGKLNPWSKPNMNERNRLASAQAQSLYFGSLFANALGWMDFGMKRYAQTFAMAQSQCRAYPDNRLFRQMAGDAMRRQGQLAAARDWYRISLDQYRKVAPGSVRHVSALGNLRLISKGLNDATALKSYTAEWKRYFPAVRDRVPSSLLDELDDADLDD